MNVVDDCAPDLIHRFDLLEMHQVRDRLAGSPCGVVRGCLYIACNPMRRMSLRTRSRLNGTFHLPNSPRSGDYRASLLPMEGIEADHDQYRRFTHQGEEPVAHGRAHALSTDDLKSA